MFYLQKSRETESEDRELKIKKLEEGRGQEMALGWDFSFFHFLGFLGFSENPGISQSHEIFWGFLIPDYSKKSS